MEAATAMLKLFCSGVTQDAFRMNYDVRGELQSILIGSRHNLMYLDDTASKLYIMSLRGWFQRQIQEIN